MTKTQQAWVKNFYDVVVSICPNAGLFAVIAIVAQAAHESSYGQSTLAKKYHNYWGMKCGSRWKGKAVDMKTWEEYTPGTKTNITAKFRAYDSVAEGVQGYCDFITSKSRYKNLIGIADDELYITTIKNDGWATDSKYIDKVSQIRLSILDILPGEEVKEPKPSEPQKATAPEDTWVVGKVYTVTTKSNLNVRAGVGKKYSIVKKYKPGTRFTCKAIIKDGENIWMRTPSGYIAVKFEGSYYIQ